jgi:predicted TIM-barrel fold metal-dependent hydrolase
VAGASLIPFFDAADLLGDGAQRLFARIAELQLPVWIHTGQHFATERPLDVCSWRHVDAIATRHPDLKLIVGHGGWPWVAPMVAVCQRHRNVYLDLSTHRGPHMRAPGSGWEPVLLHGRGSIRRQIVFGSTSWTHGLTPRQLADELVAPDLDPVTARAWLHDNALRALAPAAERNAS